MKKIIFASLVLTILFTSFAFAEENNDMMTGPGVGLVENTNVSTIYGYGSTITNMEGNAVNNTNSSDLSPTAIDSSILNPINNAAIDMGPTSGYYDGNYVEHSINDGGPGTGLISNTYGNPVVYGGGPGIGIVNNYVDQGPVATSSNITPEDFLRMYNMTIEEAAALFQAGTSTDKVGK